jgi:hypothetical protein
LANLSDKKVNGNVSDTAIAKMIHKAKTSVFISQQAVLPLFLDTTFNTDVVKEIVHAVERGVNVYILTSSTEAKYVGEGNFGYSAKFNQLETFSYLFDKMVEYKIGSGKANYISDKLFHYLHVLPTANKNHEVPNHAKVVIVDGMIAYVGSHNLYDDSHAEFGVILGKLASQELVTDYFSPLWHASLSNRGEAASSSDSYEVGDFVYVRRSLDDPKNPNNDWTLGVVSAIDLNTGEIGVTLDFLSSGPMRMKSVTPDNLSLAPGKLKHKSMGAIFPSGSDLGKTFVFYPDEGSVTGNRDGDQQGKGKERQ